MYYHNILLHSTGPNRRYKRVWGGIDIQHLSVDQLINIYFFNKSTK